MSQIQFAIKRNGEKIAFDKRCIFGAIEKAFLSLNLNDLATVATLGDEVVNEIIARNPDVTTVQVEAIQDVVEETLMKNGHHGVAKNFILYRERRARERQDRILSKVREHTLKLTLENGEKVVFDPMVIHERLERISGGLRRISVPDILESVMKQIYENIPKHEIDLITLGAVRERIEKHYDYSHLASRLIINELYNNILSVRLGDGDSVDSAYRDQFSNFISKGVDLEMLDPELKNFDMGKITAALRPERDLLFKYLGVQILYDRYFLRDRSADRAVYELPQWFWMRVAMGLSLKEENREESAIEFYTILSKMDLVSSTPTLFNSGTCHPQMSSCYINITDDSLDGIFKVFGDNAKLSKWAGGIGTDWTPVRATGSKIKGTNGTSQGVIPFIKIFNDVALAVNQGGKRKGAMCAYMEMWHLDYEQYLELKKNTGDERRRAHDVNTASWIPDLFMKRVKKNGTWTLFCPSDTPDLHDLYGKEFEERYTYYESQNLPHSKTLQAVDLWRRMLTMLYETGHPWITFKDPINLRSPQDHVGVVHSSNLCTEITLNTSSDETAVCNLASVNLAHMVSADGELDEAKIARTVGIGIRMLDNVIDNNFYPTSEAKNANLRHRAIGLGLMGFQDAVYKLDVRFDSEEMLEFADKSMEMISYYAISASTDLAKERGTYSTYEGSKWARGIFPLDTVDILEENRGEPVKVNRDKRLDWDALKAKVSEHGMRNSNTMAIAPTATIANISGVYPCTEPAFKNIYMKENLSGNFLVINDYLIDELDEIGLWNDTILSEIKLNNGSLQKIMDIPESIRDKYKEVFEIPSEWIIKAAANRAKWIDQSASTNVFVSTTSGKILNDAYTMAWEYGLKTTYYLRSLGATQIQKMTVNTEQDKNTPEEEGKPILHADTLATQSHQDSGTPVAAGGVPMCKIDDPDCEACQ